MTRIIGIAAAVVLTVVACGASPAGSAPDPCRPSAPCGGDYQHPEFGYSVAHINVDGRQVPCVVLKIHINSASLSCDWSPR
jgi:hypothetical protein